MTHGPTEKVNFLQGLDELAESIEIIDIHNHAGGWKSALVGPGAVLNTEEELRERERALARFSTDAAFLMPSPRADGGIAAVRKRNDDVAAQLELSPVLPIGLFSVPLEDQAESMGEIERCVAAGFRAISFHHLYACKPIDHPSMWPVVEAATELELPIFVHIMHDSITGFEALWRLERLAEAFPTCTFVALGAFSQYAGGLQAIQTARHYPNVLFDTSVLLTVCALAETFCEEVGPDRLLYGSDLYLGPQNFYLPYGLYEILASPLEIEAKRAILGGNARRLFGLDTLGTAKQ